MSNEEKKDDKIKTTLVKKTSTGEKVETPVKKKVVVKKAARKVVKKVNSPSSSEAPVEDERKETSTEAPTPSKEPKEQKENNTSYKPSFNRENNNYSQNRSEGNNGNYQNRSGGNNYQNRGEGNNSNYQNRNGGNNYQNRGNNGNFRQDKDKDDRKFNNQRPAQNGGANSSSQNSLNNRKESVNRFSKKIYKAKKEAVINKKEDKFDENYRDFLDVIRPHSHNAPIANPVPKEIDIMEVISVAELARKMNLKASDLIGKLMGMGMMVTINQQIDAETAIILAGEYDCKVNIVSLYEETIISSEKFNEEDNITRAPIVTIMGHVDHGKTKLLDTIRDSDITADEHGGITQHIGSYMVHTLHGNITFLDTPGHEAFTLMRARGANITDIVILVVASDDGVMPQTREAISHAQDAKVPIIVAINKSDLPTANPENIKQQLSEYNLIPTEWGGETHFISVSALTGDGIDELLTTISLEAEMLDLKAPVHTRAEGTIIEALIEQGRGVVANVIIQKGTLKIGDPFVAGVYSGKVRAMHNEHGENIEEAGPSSPVEILGCSNTPASGEPFQVVEDEKQAKNFGQKRQELKKQEEAKNIKKVTLDNFYDQIQEGNIEELKVIIKGDVHGSVEALKHSLEDLTTPEIRLTCIHAAAGSIIESDITLAKASSAIIVGFHVKPTPKASILAEQEKIDIRRYSIIYDAIEDIRSAMEGMLAPEYHETNIGTVEIREVFKISKLGKIAGCMVTNGIVKRKSSAHIVRDNAVIHTGVIETLKRFKDDAKEVKEGFECGIGIEDFNDIKEGDILQVFEMTKVPRKLSAPIKEKKGKK